MLEHRKNSWDENLYKAGLAGVIIGALLSGCTDKVIQPVTNNSNLASPIPDSGKNQQVTLIPTLTFTPPSTETPVPTATLEILSNKLKLDKSKIETLSYLDLRELNGEDYVVIPKNENEYLLGIENVDGFDLDKSVLVLGQLEIAPIKMFTDKEDKTNVFFSLPRGTKELGIKLSDGSVKNISDLLPGDEPENKFINYVNKMVYMYDGKAMSFFGAHKIFGLSYRDGTENNKIHHLPDPTGDDVRFLFDIHNVKGDNAEVFAIAERFKLIDPDDISRQQNPEIVIKGSLGSLGDFVLVYQVHILRVNFYVYMPGIGILNLSSVGYDW